MKRYIALAAVLFALVLPALSQDWIRTGTGVGGEKIRLAVADFKVPSAEAAALDKTFNAVLFNDLYQAGIFDMVSKSFYPLAAVGAPADVHLDAWARLRLTLRCWLLATLRSAGNTPGAGLALRRKESAESRRCWPSSIASSATDDNARLIAHRFADEIIFRLGGGSLRHRRNQDLLRQRSQRHTKKSGKWTTMARGSTRSRGSTPSRCRTPRLAGQFARCLPCVPQGRSKYRDVLARPRPAGDQFPHFGGDNLFSRVVSDGTRTSPFLLPAPAILRFTVSDPMETISNA